MKKIALFIFSFFFAALSIAQNKYQLYEYEVNYSLGKPLFKKGYLFIANDTLRYHTSKSYFLDEIKDFEVDPETGNPNINIGFGISNEHLLYIPNKRLVHSFGFIVNDNFLVKETMPKIPWKTTGNQKVISERKCTEFEVTFRGRKYNAWVDLTVPFGFGPWKLQDLPGLAIQIIADNGKMKWSLKSIKNLSEKEIKSFVEDQNIYLKQYPTITIKDFIKKEDEWRKNGSPVLVSRLPRDYRREGSINEIPRGGMELKYEWEGQ